MPITIANVEDLSNWVFNQIESFKPQQNITIAISGIDASGKGYISTQLAEKLSQRGKKVFLENLDGNIMKLIMFDSKNFKLFLNYVKKLH